MAIDLVDYERKAREAVQAFWGNREAARQKQIESGKADQGELPASKIGTQLRIDWDRINAWMNGKMSVLGNRKTGALHA